MRVVYQTEIVRKKQRTNVPLLVEPYSREHVQNSKQVVIVCKWGLVVSVMVHVLTTQHNKYVKTITELSVVERVALVSTQILQLHV